MRLDFNKTIKAQSIKLVCYFVISYIAYKDKGLCLQFNVVCSAYDVIFINKIIDHLDLIIN